MSPTGFAMMTPAMRFKVELGNATVCKSLVFLFSGLAAQSLHVRMYGCMYVRMYVCMYVRMYVCM